MSVTVTATEFKAKAMAYLDRAAAGETIRVTKRGAVVAVVTGPERPASLVGSVRALIGDQELVEANHLGEWDADRT